MEKQYKVIYTIDKKVIMPIGPYSLDTEILIGKGRFIEQFDTEKEALDFMDKNGLMYDRESNL